MMLDLLDGWGQQSSFVLPEQWDMDVLEANSQAAVQVFQQSIDAADKEIIHAVSGQTPTAEGAPAFANTAIHAKIRHDLIATDAATLAHLLNTQVIPYWVNERFGWGAVPYSPTVRWDTTPEKDRNQEADTITKLGTGLEAWQRLFAGRGKQLDIEAIAKKFGVPFIDGAPESLPAPGPQASTLRLLKSR